ncbi:ferrochelatase [Mesonia sp. K7]|uniref:ferrochelatase n=1 Tax=Mesonia sp. K7 TaxID=2218606 RepID=UPI000DAA9686|nr:ferrochelatase [Mesonia sp. K7]PZD77473.1 ferrochelatase [Mesonia sp. K7]
MKGVLLVNLGSPKSTKSQDVKVYLDEFLMDKRVIDVPFWLRSFIVRGIILNTRPKKSAEAYQKIWWENGSPLIVLSENLQEKVQQNINDMPVELAMRYGNPSIKEGIKKLVDQKVNEILLLPLYPQYAMATTETVIAEAERVKNEFFPQLHIDYLPAFYGKESYIKLLSKSIQESIQNLDYDHILFSYHGVPERHIKKRDITKNHCKIDKSCCFENSKAHQYCYRHQCYQTTKNVVETLGLDANKCSTSFQSRLGFDPWLQPYTDRTIEKFALSGIKKLVVVTPAFVTDCLETLEEIAMEGKEIFEENGGEEFTVIPCLNDREDWANLLSDWVKDWQTNKLETQEELLWLD